MLNVVSKWLHRQCVTRIKPRPTDRGSIEDDGRSRRRGLRVDRVASLAKINKRMIYHYFGDKEGLAAKVLEHQLLAITPVLSESEMGVLRYF